VDDARPAGGCRCRPYRAIGNAPAVPAPEITQPLASHAAVDAPVTAACTACAALTCIAHGRDRAPIAPPAPSRAAGRTWCSAPPGSAPAHDGLPATGISTAIRLGRPKAWPGRMRCAAGAATRPASPRVAGQRAGRRSSGAVLGDCARMTAAARAVGERRQSHQGGRRHGLRCDRAGRPIGALTAASGPAAARSRRSARATAGPASPGGCTAAPGRGRARTARSSGRRTPRRRRSCSPRR
jgi:hypothetical protein